MGNNKYKVLIVEDDQSILGFVQTILETNGYQVLTPCALFHELIDRLAQVIDGVLVTGGYRVYHAVAHVVFQDHLAGVVQGGTYRRQLDENLRAVVTLLHHPLHLFQVADGAGQPVQHGLLIFVDMAMTVGNAMGVEIGMVMLVVMGVAAFVGMVGHRLAPLSWVKHIFYSIPFFCVFRKPSRGISAQK